MRQNRKKGLLAILAIAAYLIFPSSYAAQTAAKRKKPPVAKNSVKVVELHNIEQLKEVFQADIGKVRLVTILSPT